MNKEDQNSVEKAKEGFDEWLTTEEAAEWLKISPRSLREYVRRKEVPFLKIGRHTRFKKEDFSPTLPRRQIR